MKDQNAIIPNQITHTYRTIREDKTETDKAEDTDKLIADLNGDPRWEALKKVGESMIKQLETMQGQIADTDTPETIGFKFLACSVASTKIRELLMLPESITVTNESINGTNTG